MVRLMGALFDIHDALFATAPVLPITAMWISMTRLLEVLAQWLYYYITPKNSSSIFSKLRCSALSVENSETKPSRPTRHTNTNTFFIVVVRRAKHGRSAQYVYHQE